MVININESEKTGVTHALRVAMGNINSSLRTAFDGCHPDRKDLRWYKWVEDMLGVLRELKRLLDKIEEAEAKTGEDNGSTPRETMRRTGDHDAG